MKVLITGAAGGIGKALAQFLAGSGAVTELVLVDLAADKLNEVVINLKKDVTVTSFVGNLADSSFLIELCDYVKSANLDVLVNNAAVAHTLKEFAELSDEEFNIGMDVNVRAVFKLTKASLPSMQQRKSGQIFNIASRANIYGYPSMGIYAASKAAITSFSQTIALENPELKSVIVLPGRTNTTMQLNLRGKEVAQTSQTPEFVADVIGKSILGEYYVNNGDILLIDNSKWAVVTELFRADLHRNVS